jgi:NAD(P)-dependent dehydrogenase (short-subunit alcohol dehydrogenase family)
VGRLRFSRTSNAHGFGKSDVVCLFFKLPNGEYIVKKVWMITGASRGLGASIGNAVLGNGDYLIATARRRDSLEAIAGSESCLTLALDVTDEAQSRAAVREAISRFGRIDVLVNNAGYGLTGAIEETSPEEVEAVYRTNVFGLLNVTRAVLPVMRGQRSGHVINVSSMGGYQANPTLGIYASTKFAIEGISEALYAEVKPLGIRVTAIGPGFLRTDFLDQSSLKHAKVTIDDYAEAVAKTRTFSESNNGTQPGDPARLAAFHWMSHRFACPLAQTLWIGFFERTSSLRSRQNIGGTCPNQSTSRQPPLIPNSPKTFNSALRLRR